MYCVGVSHIKIIFTINRYTQLFIDFKKCPI